MIPTCIRVRNNTVPSHRLVRQRTRIILLKFGMSRKSSTWSIGWTKDRYDGGLMIAVSMVTAKALLKNGSRRHRVVRTAKGKKLNGWKRQRPHKRLGWSLVGNRAAWHKTYLARVRKKSQRKREMKSWRARSTWASSTQANGFFRVRAIRVWPIRVGPIRLGRIGLFSTKAKENPMDFWSI